MLGISTVRIVPVPKRSSLETPRRELSDDVSFRIGTLLVVDQSRLGNRRGRCHIPGTPYQVYGTRTNDITVIYLHRFLWEQKVAKKVKVCKLISQLSSCTLLMGAKSCAKSLATFTFDNNRAIWSKSLQTFCVANVAEESCTAEIIPVRDPAKNMNCSRGSHNPYTITRASPTRRTPHQIWTWITRYLVPGREHRQPVKRGCCGSSSCSSFDRDGLRS